MLKIRRSWDRLIFHMGIPILVRQHLYIETAHWFSIKIQFYVYRKSHFRDKTVVRSSYLHNVISYTGKMPSSYWIGTLGSSFLSMSKQGFSQWEMLQIKTMFLIVLIHCIKTWLNYCQTYYEIVQLGHNPISFFKIIYVWVQSCGGKIFTYTIFVWVWFPVVLSQWYILDSCMLSHWLFLNYRLLQKVYEAWLRYVLWLSNAWLTNILVVYLIVRYILCCMVAG